MNDALRRHVRKTLVCILALQRQVQQWERLVRYVENGMRPMVLAALMLFATTAAMAQVKMTETEIRVVGELVPTEVVTNDHQMRITDLEADVATLQAQVVSLQAQVASLVNADYQGQIDAMQAELDALPDISCFECYEDPAGVAPDESRALTPFYVLDACTDPATQVDCFGSQLPSTP